jgi:hypothetical protein
VGTHFLTKGRRESGEIEARYCQREKEAKTLKIKIAFVVLIVAAVFVAADSQQSDTPADASAQTEWERGLHEVDGVLQEGLGEDSHHALADGFSESAGFLKGAAGGVGEHLNGISE